MADVWKVVTTAADRARTLFQGLEKDARQYVERNFPRPHVEPPGDGGYGKADVHLVSPSGSKEEYHAEDGWNAAGRPEPTDSAPVQGSGPSGSAVA